MDDLRLDTVNYMAAIDVAIIASRQRSAVLHDFRLKSEYQFGIRSADDVLDRDVL